MSHFKIDLRINKSSKDGSLLGKVNDFQKQMKAHEEQHLNIYKKPPSLSGSSREVKVLDRHTQRVKTM
jgi:glycine C-acetyltransferase/8-amino-7-oxononanoate synthase